MRDILKSAWLDRLLCNPPFWTVSDSSSDRPAIVQISAICASRGVWLQLAGRSVGVFPDVVLLAQRPAPAAVWCR
jgi:hypothetical protein